MRKNKNIKVRIRILLLLLFLVVFLSSHFMFLDASITHNKGEVINEKNIRSANIIWNYPTKGIVWSVATSSDGQYIVSASEDNNVYLFDRRSFTPLWNYTMGNYVYTVAISSDGQYIVAGSGDYKVYLFNKTSSTPLWSYATGGSVWSVAISSDGQYIVAGGEDKTVYLFDRTNSTPLWSYTMGVWVNSVAISSDGQYITAGGYAVYLFNRTSSIPLWSYNTGDIVWEVAISSDGQYIAAGGFSSKVYLFNKTSSIPLWSYSAGEIVESVAMSSNGGYIVVGGANNNVFLFNRTSSSPLWSYTSGDIVWKVAISSDGQYIAAGSKDFKVYFFDKTSSTPLWNYTTGDEVNSVAISSNGVYVAAGSYDYKVYLFGRTPSHFELSDANDPNLDGIFSLIWAGSSGATNYSVYMHSCYINEINGSLTLLADEITDLSLDVIVYLDGIYYFIVVAHNLFGDTLSNCINISIHIYKWLTIITPDNYSSWEHGTSRRISWFSIGSITGIKIELYRNDEFVMEIISSTFNDGEYYWVVFSGLISSDRYQIKIIDILNASIFDYSDHFEIKSPSSWLMIITPDNYSSWEHDTSRRISWFSIGSISDIKIELYRNDEFVMEIISSTFNDGEYYWVVFSGLIPSDRYQIKIIDILNASIFDYSDYFEIKSPLSTESILGYNLYVLLTVLSIVIIIIGRNRRNFKG